MSSISAQGVVERASAELSKRINGLGLSRGSSSKHHSSSTSSSAPSPKSSVMERVTNVFCGGGERNAAAAAAAAANAAAAAPEKPSSRLLPTRGSSRTAANSAVLASSAASGHHHHHPHNNLNTGTAPTGGARRSRPIPAYLTWDQLMMDERFLAKFFLYFSACDRCVLAQVCVRWRDLLYRSPKYWTGLVPVLQCREMRAAAALIASNNGVVSSHHHQQQQQQQQQQHNQHDRARLYASLLRRGFHSLCLMGASDEDVLDLVNTFPLASKHIHSVSLRCSSVTDRGLETLLDHLQALHELELAGCNEITEAGLWACLNARIVSLTLTDCINVADEAVGAVAQLLPALYEFSLQAYHVTDAALGYFSPKQSNSLNVLRLHSCWEVTNHGVVNIVHSLPNLTVLSLSGCSKITDDGVELIAENLQKLRCLDLSWCPRITDAALEYIACDLNQLEELTLDRCVHITDIGIGYISTMISLSALYLRWCSQIRDFGLQHLCGMRNLQILSLAGCPLLTSSGLSSLIQLRHMRELELTNCPGASRELFDYLREHLPRCLVIE